MRKAIEEALKSMCSDITRFLAEEVQQREDLADRLAGGASVLSNDMGGVPPPPMECSAL